MIPVWWSALLAALGLAGIWLTTRKDSRGLALGVLAQVLWVAYAVATRQWGFIATALAYGLLYGRGWLQWRRDEREIVR